MNAKLLKTSSGFIVRIEVESHAEGKAIIAKLNKMSIKAEDRSACTW